MIVTRRPYAGSGLVYPDTVPVTGVPVIPADGDLELPAVGRASA